MSVRKWLTEDRALRIAAADAGEDVGVHLLVVGDAGCVVAAELVRRLGQRLVEVLAHVGAHQDPAPIAAAAGTSSRFPAASAAAMAATSRRWREAAMSSRFPAASAMSSRRRRGGLPP